METKKIDTKKLILIIGVSLVIAFMIILTVAKITQKSTKKYKTEEERISAISNEFIMENCVNSKTNKCPETYLIKNNNQEKYLCLNDLEKNKKIEEVKIKGKKCEGIIVYKKDSQGTYNKGETYLYCGLKKDKTYEYTTNSKLNTNLYTKCNININEDIDIIEMMKKKVLEVDKKLEQINTLFVDLNNNKITKEKVIKQIDKIKEEIDDIYNYQYKNSFILHQENNTVTGKYVYKLMDSESLGLNTITKDNLNMYIAKEAQEEVKEFIIYLDARIRIKEYETNFEVCKEKECKDNIVINIVERIHTISNDIINEEITNKREIDVLNIEIKDTFEILNNLSKLSKNEEYLKTNIFPKGKDVLTKEEAKVIESEAIKYLKEKLREEEEVEIPEESGKDEHENESSLEEKPAFPSNMNMPLMGKKIRGGN